MTWLIFSFLSAFTFSVVTVMDKVIISKHVSSAKVFILGLGITQTAMGFYVFPWLISHYPLIPSLIAVLSGIVCGIYLIIMFMAMESQDVSRLIPVVSTYPIFVAFLSYVFLGESIGVYVWLSIILTVSGAVMVSLGPSQSGRPSTSMLLMVLLFFASMCFGLSQFLAKIIVDDMELWPQFMLRGLGVGIASFFVIFFPGVKTGFFQLVKTPKSFLLFFFSEGVLAFAAIAFFYFAIYAGEVYLVSTVMSSRPVFVFFLGIILSLPFIKILSERLEGKALYIRAIGTFITVAGVSGVALL